MHHLRLVLALDPNAGGLQGSPHPLTGYEGKRRRKEGKTLLKINFWFRPCTHNSIEHPNYSQQQKHIHTRTIIIIASAYNKKLEK